MNEFASLLELLKILVTDPRTVVLFALLIVASVSDCRTYRIPNWLTMTGAAIGIIYNSVAPLMLHNSFLWALSGLALGFLITLPLYALRAMGAGDVKLIAMVGAFLGAPDIFYAVLCTLIVGGVAALGFAFSQRSLGRMFGNVKNIVQVMMFSVMGGVRPDVHIDVTQSVGKLPYGVSVSIGTIGYVVAKQLGYL